MTDYIFLMHDDAAASETGAAWAEYLHKLRATGQFDGGSAIGRGACVSRTKPAVGITAHLSGYLRELARQ